MKILIHILHHPIVLTKTKQLVWSLHYIGTGRRRERQQVRVLLMVCSQFAPMHPESRNLNELSQDLRRQQQSVWKLTGSGVAVMQSGT